MGVKKQMKKCSGPGEGEIGRAGACQVLFFLTRLKTQHARHLNFLGEVNKELLGADHGPYV